jgi:hypothetical protein
MCVLLAMPCDGSCWCKQKVRLPTIPNNIFGQYGLNGITWGGKDKAE